MKSGSFEYHIKTLLDKFETSQYNHVPNFDLVKNLPVLTREELQVLPMQKHFSTCRSSGSTGIPVTVEKTILDHLWYMATNIREMLWLNWNFSKTKATIKLKNEKKYDLDSWGISKELFKNQGKSYHCPILCVQELQEWLEEKNPDYLHCFPSIVEQLDLTKLNLLGVKGTGELGGTMYSSEECGTIAIQCPHNKNNYHVMENNLVETNSDGEFIITCLTNPYIKRYKIGDVGELGTCNCGRGLQTITKIVGRIRNLFVTRDGRKTWPRVGSLFFYEKYGIKRFKAIQKTLDDVEIQIISNKLSSSQEESLKTDVQNNLGNQLNIHLNYVENFPNYKFEEFVCDVKV